MYCKNCKETYDDSYFIFCPRCGTKLEVKQIPNIGGRELEELILETEDLLDDTISQRKDIENHLKKLTFEYLDLQHKISNETDKNRAIELKFIAMKIKEDISKINELQKEVTKNEEDLSKSLENLKNELKILKDKQLEQINREKHKDFVFKKIYVADDISLKILYRLYEPIGFERDKTTAINRLIDICPFEIVESDLDTIENEGVNNLKEIDINESIKYEDAIYDSIQKLDLINENYEEKLYEDMKSIFYDENDYDVDGDYVSYKLNEIAEYFEKLKLRFIHGTCPVCGYNGNATISSRCFKCGVDLEKDLDGTKKIDINIIEGYINKMKPLIKSFMLAKETLQHRNNLILKEKEELLNIEEEKRKIEEEINLENLADDYCDEEGFDDWKYFNEGMLFFYYDSTEEVYFTEEELRSMK